MSPLHPALSGSLARKAYHGNETGRVPEWSQGKVDREKGGLTHLYEYGLKAIVVAVERGAAVWLAGQIDARGAVQLLQLVVTTLLLDHPVGRAVAVPGLLGEAKLRIEARGEG